MKDIIIRRCHQNEVEDLVIFARTLFTEAFADQNDPVHFEAYVSQAYTIKAFQSLFNHHDVDFFIAEKNDKIAGYMQVNQEDAQTEFELENALEVQRIYVAVHMQRKGLGKILIDFAKQLAVERKKDWLWLGVWEHNSRALAFYQREGFEIFSSHTFMMGEDPQTDIMLKWKVS